MILWSHSSSISVQGVGGFIALDSVACLFDTFGKQSTRKLHFMGLMQSPYFRKNKGTFSNLKH